MPRKAAAADKAAAIAGGKPPATALPQHVIQATAKLSAKGPRPPAPTAKWAKRSAKGPKPPATAPPQHVIQAYRYARRRAAIGYGQAAAAAASAVASAAAASIEIDNSVESGW